MKKEHPIPWNPALPDLPVSHSLWLNRQSEPSLSNELRCWCLSGELLSEPSQISGERQTSPEAAPGLLLTLEVTGSTLHRASLEFLSSSWVGVGEKRSHETRWQGLAHACNSGFSSEVAYQDARERVLKVGRHHRLRVF